MHIQSERLEANRWFWVVLAAILLGAFASTGSVLAQDAQETRPYRLYQNPEKYGIVIWPRQNIYPELEDFVTSLGFKVVDEGLGKMRFDDVNRNGTYMMPESVQKEHEIERFIILQILDDRLSIMVGIWEQEFGLTLPQKVYGLDEVKKNIPETLEMFRELSGKKPISWPPR